MVTNNQEQALYKLSQILHSNKETRRKFERAANLATFEFWGPGQMRECGKVTSVKI